MKIEKLIIENFKCFEGRFEICLNEDVNILVGNNEAGKSTILEAIHLALTGMLNGRYLKNELSQYLFNRNIEKQYINSVKQGTPVETPHILIELYIKNDGSPEAGLLKGNDNSSKEDTPGVLYSIEFDEAYKPLYDDLVQREGEEVKTIPIEYYRTSRRSFARKETYSLRLFAVFLKHNQIMNTHGNAGLRRFVCKA